MTHFFWHHVARLVANTRCVSLWLLLQHTKLHYWVTRRAADANLRILKS